MVEFAISTVGALLIPALLVAAGMYFAPIATIAGLFLGWVARGVARKRPDRSIAVGLVLGLIGAAVGAVCGTVQWSIGDHGESSTHIWLLATCFTVGGAYTSYRYFDTAIQLSP